MKLQDGVRTRLFRKIALLAIGITTALALSSLAQLFLTTDGFPCLIHEVFGLYCPGCGTTRLLMSAKEGEFSQAILHNPIILLILPGVLLYLRTKKRSSKRAFEWLAIVTVFAYFALRNLPCFSSTCLTP